MSRALVGEREEAPLGLVSHFPPGAELSGVCVPSGDGRAFKLLTGISSQPGWGGVEMPWMFREQLLRAFRVWKKWVSTLPC